MQHIRDTLIFLHPTIIHLLSIFTGSVKGLGFPPYLQVKTLAGHSFIDTG